MHHHHNHQHLHHHGVHSESNPSPHMPDTVSRNRLPFTIVPDETLVKRMPMPMPMPSTDSGSVDCTDGNNSNRCEKPASSSSTTTLPIVLGAVIPIVAAIVVLIYLHRRNLKKLRREDAEDKHKSLDFGMEIAPSKRGGPMRETEKGPNHWKGMSLDIGHSPYMLPPSIRGSKDSLNSLSKSIRADDGIYRQANQLFAPDNQSLKSNRRGYPDETASIGGSVRRGAFGDDMNQGLLGNAQRVSRSSPPLYNSSNENDMHHPTSHGQVHDTGFELNLPRSPSPVFIPGLPAINEPTPTTHRNASNGSANGLATSSSPLNNQSEFLPRDPSPTPAQPQAVSMPTPRISLPSSDGASDYGDYRAPNSTIPAVNVESVEKTSVRQEDYDMPTLPEEPSQTQNMKLDPRRDTRRLTMGLRPLPPEDPSDNPEQRANRIRSFYKEYFDDSKPSKETYYEDYDPNFYPEDEMAYDPVTGDYYDVVPAPYAEPVTRRAMTPPPRAPPRFQGAPRHMATGSMGGFDGGFQGPGSRAFSSASGHFPRPRGPPRPVPPPAPLTILPSPHLLKDDSIMSAIGYAPGNSFKDQREGRPETPHGGVRAFHPMVRAHTPLASAFDELSAIPSPHALRKSGTFDNLDFAPPPRFKNADTASDAGSIRSNRTGISANHLYNIRTGAYRVSRLPPETVGTKDDLMSNLRPAWDMRQ